MIGDFNSFYIANLRNSFHSYLRKKAIFSAGLVKWIKMGNKIKIFFLAVIN